MFWWNRKKKEDIPEEIEEVKCLVTLGVSVRIEVATDQNNLYTFDYTVSRSVVNLNGAPQHIVEEIEKRAQMSEKHLSECDKLHAQNARLEKEAFRGSTLQQEIVSQYKKIRHQIRKNKNAVERIIEARSPNHIYEKASYRGKEFTIRILGQRQA